MINLVGLLVAFAIILVSMMLHELAHGWAAYWLGDDTAKDEGRLTLNPLKHLDPVLSIALPLLLFISGGPVFGGAKPVPVDSRKLKHGVWGMALVAIAGPLMNFILAFIGVVIVQITGALVDGNQTLFWSEVLMQFIVINLGFGVFNLIPIPPLDGSRVLYAIAPDQVREVMAKMENWGIILVMMLVILLPSVINNIMLGAMQGILDAFFWITGGFK